MEREELFHDSNNAEHTRINHSITYAVEKRALLWFAAHMPDWVTSDHMSLLGFIAAVLIGISYPLANRAPVFLWVAVAGFILNWFGDSMDGTLARYRKVERPRYGYFLDHSIDVICITIILTSLGFSGYARIELAWAVNLLYLLMVIYTSLVNFTSRSFQISFASIGPTEIRILAIFMSIWLFFNDQRFIHLGFMDLNILEAILLLLIIVFVPIYLLSTVLQIRRLAKEEPLTDRPE